MQSATPGFLMCKPRQKIGLKGVGFQDLACSRNDVGEFFDMELSEKAAFLFSEMYLSLTCFPTGQRLPPTCSPLGQS